MGSCSGLSKLKRRLKDIKKISRRSGLNSPRWYYLWGPLWPSTHTPHQVTWSLCFLYHVMLSCLWVFIQAVLSVFETHTFIPWITLMHPPNHCSGITSFVEYLSFIEIIYLAALYWAHLYQELWDVLGTWEWLRQFILCSFIDEMKWCKKKSSLNDKVRHLTVTCIGCNGDVSGAMDEQVSGEKATCKGFYLTLFMNKCDRQRLSG